MPPISKLNYMTSKIPEMFEGKLPKTVRAQILTLDFDSWKDVQESLKCSQKHAEMLQRLCRATAPRPSKN